MKNAASPAKSAPSVAVVGSANMDLFVTTARRPEIGETVLGESFSTIAGGKGLNQAIAAARAGASTEFLGAVGDDTFALELRETLVMAEVGTDWLRELPGSSGIAVVTADGDGENTIIVVSGANSQFRNLTRDELSVIARSDVLLAQLEVPLETVVAAATHAHASGTTVVLNAAPARALPHELLATIDVLVVNEIESLQIGPAALAEISAVVTTLGASGATARIGTAEYTVPSIAMEAIDSTGAGDAFAGVLACSWHLGPEVALRRACVAGALATTRIGASTAMPTAEQIDAALDTHH